MFRPCSWSRYFSCTSERKRMCTSQKETPHHRHPTAPLSRGLGAIVDPGPKESSSPGILPPHPCTRCCLLSASPHQLAPPPLIGNEPRFFKSSPWNKRRYRFSLSPPPLPPLLSPSTSVLFSLFSHLAVSTSLRLRKLCYHGDAWGWGLIGGVCCDAASWWCSPPDWVPFQWTPISNAETRF